MRATPMNSQNLPIKIKARGNFKLNLENRFTPEEKEEIAVRIGTFQTDEEIKEWAEARKKTITINLIFLLNGTALRTRNTKKATTMLVLFLS